MDRLNLKLIGKKRALRSLNREILQHQLHGKNLRPVDFEKLEIESKYVADENERNSKILNRLKLANGI